MWYLIVSIPDVCNLIYFDQIWHKCLLFKLKSTGVSGSLLTWFSDYLTDMKQRVVLHCASSSWTSVKAGVPQGSIP